MKKSFKFSNTLKWNMPIFNNIANSEQTHTDAVKTLLKNVF